MTDRLLLFFYQSSLRLSTSNPRLQLAQLIIQLINSFIQKSAAYANSFQTLLKNSFHLAVCLTTGPKPLPNRALHTVRSRASSFKYEYHLLSLRSSSSFLRFLPRLPVTSIPPFIFPSITRCSRQFLRKM